MTDSQWGQLVILATTVGGFVVQAWRENRNRRWATEDRRAATEEIVARAKAEATAARILLEGKTQALAEQLRVEALAAAAKLREDQRIEADNLRLETLKTASGVRSEQRQHSAAMLERIDSAKDAAHQAYSEANHVNLKIEDLNKRLLQQGDRQRDVAQASNQVIEEIGVAGADTNVRVRAIEDATVPPGKP